MRRAAWVFLAVVFAVSLLADFVAPYSFATQFREAPNAAASPSHLLGTDALGRDRLSRLLYGARVSLLLAPAAALVSVALAIAIALFAASSGPWCRRLTMGAADLCLSLPWIFLLIAARALLPLSVAPGIAALVTFGLLGALGWAGPSRVMASAIQQHRQSDFVLLAQAFGCGPARLALVHLAPNLMPLVLAQLLIAIPTYLLAEANLGLLGLGIPEPLPSWGSLLRELENVQGLFAHPWALAPAFLLILVVGSFHVAVSADKYNV
jgi:ABC-type dipeptide/oligopeptide/nickel transport system permease subunit